MLYQDNENYMEISRAFCGPCEKPRKSGFFMDYTISGAWGFYQQLAKNTDIYMKLRNKNNVITGYYATKPDQWISMGKLGNLFDFKRVGIGVTNSDGGNKVDADLITRVDFIEIRRPE